MSRGFKAFLYVILGAVIWITIVDLLAGWLASSS
jgi:hypothetical protein